MGVGLIPGWALVSLSALTGCSLRPEEVVTGAGGQAGTAGADGAALNIAPHASRIACGSTVNYVVLADHSIYEWDSGAQVTRDSVGQYAQVSAEGEDACFLMQDSTVRCLASDAGVDKNVPQGTFLDVRLGESFAAQADACARDSSGQLSCWGTDYDVVQPFSQAPRGAVSDYDLGADKACAVLEDGSAQCWGRMQPASAGTNFASIYTNDFASCALSRTHDLACWTLNGVAPTTDVAELAIGQTFACGILGDGRAFCFAPGNGSLAPAPPAAIRLLEVAVGESQACGILVDGSVTCWGPIPAGDAKQRPPPDPIQVF